MNDFCKKKSPKPGKKEDSQLLLSVMFKRGSSQLDERLTDAPKRKKPGQTPFLSWGDTNVTLSIISVVCQTVIVDCLHTQIIEFSFTGLPPQYDPGIGIEVEQGHLSLHTMDGPIENDLSDTVSLRVLDRKWSEDSEQSPKKQNGRCRV